jgi:hypothetical protein
MEPPSQPVGDPGSPRRRFPDALYLWLLPFFAGGVALHLWQPQRLLPCICAAIPAGLALLLLAVLLGMPVVRGKTSEWGPAVVAVYVAAALFLNSLWPLALLIPALAAMIRWRAVRVQTGHRRHEDA